MSVTRLSWHLIHLETDLKLRGEPPAVGVWTREEARDAEDDIVAVRIVRDAVTIRNHCPIACHNEYVIFHLPTLFLLPMNDIGRATGTWLVDSLKWLMAEYAS